MPEVARTFGEHPQRIWGILLHHVAQTYARMNLEEVRLISVGGVCRARGQDYLAIVSEPKQEGHPRLVLLAVEDRDR